MHIAIVHYHLQPGGVFQVIANHLQSLKVFCDTDSDHRVALFHGGLGCLLFALSGRALLGFVLNGVANHGDRSSIGTVPSADLVEKDSGVLAQEKLTAEQMSEAVAKPNQPIVETKA